MHVLELTDFYHPVIGGLERHVATLSSELVRLGHSVTVVTLQLGDLPTEEVIEGVRVVRIRSWSQNLKHFYADDAHPFHPPMPDPGTVADLRKVIRREHPDVVHSNSWLAYSFFPLYHPRKGPAHVVSLHDYGLACARKTLQRSQDAEQCQGPQLVRCLSCAPAQYGPAKGAAIVAALRASRRLNLRADRYIAVSKAVVEGTRQAVPSNVDTVVVPTMVPSGVAAVAKATPRPDFLPAEDGYLMFVGALGSHKGVDVLLEARSRMQLQPSLVVLGTPRADSPPIGGSGVVLVHNVPNSQVMAAWMCASVAVVPSVWQEPMGQVAIEAMLVGRPVVASDVGGLRDIVSHGVTGLLVPPGDPNALATALDSLLDDPQQRQRMGEAGRIRAHRFEAAEIAPRIVAVFEDALHARAKMLDAQRLTRT